MSELSTLPKNQAVLDRLRRRIENYRKHHDESIPRHEHTVNGLTEQQKTETAQLRQRFIEAKAKKSQKKSDKKQDLSQNSASKSHKRQIDDGQSSTDLGSSSTTGENYEPPKKMAIGNNGPSPSPIGGGHFNPPGHSSSPSKAQSSRGGSNSKMKFVHPDTRNKNGLSSSSTPLGRTTPTASHPTSSSAVGTTTTTTNNQVVGNLSSLPGQGLQQQQQSLMEFKQESLTGSGFVDLDQCAAALEKDAQENGGSIMGGLIMDTSSANGMINSDILDDLMSEISGFNSDFMEDFGFGDDDASSALLDNKLSDNNLVIVGNLTSATGTSTTPSSSSNSTNQICGGGLDNPSTSSSYPVTPITPTNCNSPILHHHHHQHQQHQLPSGNVKLEGGGCSDASPFGSHMGLTSHSSLSHQQCAGPSPAPATTASPLASQLNTGGTPPYASSCGGVTPNSIYDRSGSPSVAINNVPSSNKSRMQQSYNSPAASTLPIDSPAAQTLKQMAEQHQHKAQMGLAAASSQNNPQVVSSFKPNASSPARSPFNNDSYGNFPPSGPPSTSNTTNDFMCASSNSNNSNSNNNSANSNNNNNNSNISNNSNSNSGGQYQGGGPRPPPLGHSPGLGVVDPSLLHNVVKQEVYSPTTQTSFSPGFLDVKRGVPGGMNGQQQQGMVGVSSGVGPHGGNRMQQQQQQQQVLSPVNKSFNHSGGMDSSLMSGQSFINRQPNSNNSNPSNYPSFQPNSLPPQQQQQQQMSMPPSHVSAQPQMAGRGSPSGPLDPKGRIGLPPPQQQQQQQQQQFYYPNNVMHGGGGGPLPPQGSMMDSNSFNPGGMGQGSGPQGQTINFTQQHLRVGGGGGNGGNMPPRMNLQPNMNHRMPGPGGPIPRMPQDASGGMGPGGMNPRLQKQQQQQQQVQQQHQMMRQQQLAQQQGMGNPMMNRYPPGVGPRGPNVQNVQMMNPQQSQQIMSGPSRPLPQQQQQQHQHQQMYGNNGPQQQQMMNVGNQQQQQQQQLMGGPSVGSSQMNMPMRGMYGGNNHSSAPPMMPSNNNSGPGPSQQPNMPMNTRGGSEWMPMQDPNSRSYPPNGIPQHGPPQGRPSNMAMSYHSVMPMQQQQPGGGVIGGNFGQSGMMNPGMGYNQQQQLGGFNQNNMKMGNPSGPPPQQSHPQQQQSGGGMYGNSNFVPGMKLPSMGGNQTSGGMMCPNPQQQQQMFGGGGMKMGGHPSQPQPPPQPSGGMSNDFNFDQVLDNITNGGGGNVDPSGFSTGDTAEFLNSFDSSSNYQNILDAL